MFMACGHILHLYTILLCLRRDIILSMPAIEQ